MRSHNPSAKEELKQYKGMAFDKTRRFNVYKEKNAPRFKKRTEEVENIINPHVDSELYHKEHIMEEKIDELKTLGKSLFSLKKISETT